MADGFRYMVFRRRTPDGSKSGDQYDTPFYGWTTSKKILKAFLTQRDKNKYVVKKMDDEDIAEYFSENDIDMFTMIDFVRLKVVSTGETVDLFMTNNELREAERRIQKYFRDICAIVDRPGYDSHILLMYMNLTNYYASALTYIGFTPPEIDSLFDDAPYHDNLNGYDNILTEIEFAYDGVAEARVMGAVFDHEVPGLKVMSKDISKVLYSLESFIKVLKDDM